MEETRQNPEIARADAPPEMEGNLSTRIQYTLRFTGAPSLGQLVAVAVATAVYTVLSWLVLQFFPSPLYGIGTVFVPIALGIPFAIWFGGWAFVIAYIGNFVGAGLLTGQSLPIAMLGGVADIIQLGLPMLLYRLLASRFGVNPIGKDVFTGRGFLFFLFAAVLPNNIIGGAYGTYILIVAGYVKPELFFFGWFLWAASNIVVMLVIGSVVLATLGPVVERFGLTVRNAFS